MRMRIPRLSMPEQSLKLRCKANCFCPKITSWNTHLALPRTLPWSLLWALLPLLVFQLGCESPRLRKSPTYRVPWLTVTPGGDIKPSDLEDSEIIANCALGPRFEGLGHHWASDCHWIKPGMLPMSDFSLSTLSLVFMFWPGCGVPVPLSMDIPTYRWQHSCMLQVIENPSIKSSLACQCMLCRKEVR